jgi:hypothetical protein
MLKASKRSIGSRHCGPPASVTVSLTLRPTKHCYISEAFAHAWHDGAAHVRRAPRPRIAMVRRQLFPHVQCRIVPTMVISSSRGSALGQGRARGLKTLWCKRVVYISCVVRLRNFQQAVKHVEIPTVK